jgi:hypothetical protein
MPPQEEKWQLIGRVGRSGVGIPVGGLVALLCGVAAPSDAPHQKLEANDVCMVQIGRGKVLQLKDKNCPLPLLPSPSTKIKSYISVIQIVLNQRFLAANADEMRH